MALTERREVVIPIGKRSYLMQTQLDDDRLNRVVGIVNDVCGRIDGDIDQENLLMLTCLQLAYNLEKITGLLESLDGKLNDLKR